MGSCIAKTAHSCGTLTGLQIFQKDDSDKIDGFCFSCGTFVKNPLGDDKTIKDIPEGMRVGKTKEEMQQDLEEIRDEFVTVDLKDRRLRKDALLKFGVKVGLCKKDGKTPRTICYPYYKGDELTAFKIKLIQTKEEIEENGKKIWSVGDQKDVDFFGWQQAIESGAKRLIITEGEDDAVAGARILDLYTKEDFKDYIPAVVSLPHGAASAANDIARLASKIRQYFKEVSFCFDHDDAGEKATEASCIVFPDATVISLPLKDLNDCLINGKGKAAFKAITFNAQKKKNTRLVFGEDIHEEAREQAQWGELTWPWERLNEVTRGIRYGETVYVGAGVKMGKSELLNALGAHFIDEHGVKVFMAKPEEANKKSYKLMAGKIVGKVFHDPKVEFDFAAYDKAGEILKGKLGMVNLYQHLGWETLKADIYAAAAWGAKVVFIDPITNLTNGMESGEANIVLQAIAQELAAMALDLNLVIFIFCHLKANEGAISQDNRMKKYSKGQYLGLGGCPHELGGNISSVQFAGSRAMMRSCNLMLGLEGNKDPELDQSTRNIRRLSLLEDREFGQVGQFDLYWNANTTLFEEM